MERLAEDGVTSHPILVALLNARRLNGYCGGVVVTPWELNENYECYVDYITAVYELDRLPVIQQRKQAIADYFAQKAAQNKHYNSYRH